MFLNTDKVDTVIIPNVSGLLSPSDSTTYYFGGLALLVPTTTDTANDFNLGYAYVITSVCLGISANTTAGTNENVTLQIRNTTQGTSSSVGVFQTNGGSATAVANFTFTGLNIAIASGDFICIQIDCPAWATNPIATRFSCDLTVRRT